MKDDLLRRLRQCEAVPGINGQSYAASRNIDGDEAADEIERLTAELAALRENSLAVLTRVRAYRDKVITERDALLALLREARIRMWTDGWLPVDDLCTRIDDALNKGGGDE